MIEDAATIIALGAAFVAALSALYARWQAKAAQDANKISLHENRLAVYKGLIRFRAHISVRGISAKEEEVWRFAELAELSEFYYPADIHARLDNIFEQAREMLSLNHEWEEAKTYGEHEKVSELNKKRDVAMRGARDDCFKIANEIKLHLRIGGA